MRLPNHVAVVVLVIFFSGCVDQRCYENEDCAAPQICSSVGECKYECKLDNDCASGFTCTNYHCQPQLPDVGPSPTPLNCPAEMATVADAFCMDKYEASRLDASTVSEGVDDSAAKSVAGVLPWQVASNSLAASACQAVGKRLCTAAEWQLACAGSEARVYAYGNSYEPTTCNGIDAFGWDSFHLIPTGSFSRCVNEWGVYDLNGNLWEHVANGSDQTIRGGAFNCGDSATLHRCAYVPGNWSPSARGFRCCKDRS